MQATAPTEWRRQGTDSQNRKAAGALPQWKSRKLPALIVLLLDVLSTALKFRLRVSDSKETKKREDARSEWVVERLDGENQRAAREPESAQR